VRSNPILYGSWARDEATEDSDIEILVIIEGYIEPGKEIDRMIRYYYRYKFKI
jgi:predicted nucleotidyltransferase